MTALEDRSGRPSAPEVRRTDVELLLEQLRGIDAWTRAHRSGLDEVQVGASREQRLDLTRRRDVVVRERQALLDWAARQLRDSAALLRSAAPVRAVLVHRNAWFRSKLGAGLQDGGLTVVADLENGADALGVVVAEQPDVLLLEDRLPMVSGLELCREAAQWAPRTVLAVQVVEECQVGPFLQAGASRVYSRRSPPGDVAADLLDAVHP